MSGMVKIPSGPAPRVYRNGGIFLETISLPSTPHGLGYEATVSWYEEGGRLSDIYGELSAELLRSGFYGSMVLYNGKEFLHTFPCECRGALPYLLSSGKP